MDLGSLSTVAAPFEVLSERETRDWDSRLEKAEVMV